MKKQRFRGIHYYYEPNGILHIWIYNRDQELMVALRIDGSKIKVEKGAVA